LMGLDVMAMVGAAAVRSHRGHPPVFQCLRSRVYFPDPRRVCGRIGEADLCEESGEVWRERARRLFLRLPEDEQKGVLCLAIDEAEGAGESAFGPEGGEQLAADGLAQNLQRAGADFEGLRIHRLLALVLVRRRRLWRRWRRQRPGRARRPRAMLSAFEPSAASAR